MRSGWIIYLALTSRQPRRAAAPDDVLAPIEPGAFRTWAGRDGFAPAPDSVAGAVCSMPNGRPGRLVEVTSGGRVQLVCQIV